jgi:ATP-dependent Lon protease
VLVLDEVDKMGVDLRGDPAAALLEVLDPSQNDTFVDHYIDLPFDLSEVVFIATANYRGNIPEPLKDRMEMIEVLGYTRTEKRSIAQQFLVPKQLRENGLTNDQVTFEKEGLETIIDHYTREAGVRGLEREIAAVCRDVTVRFADKKLTSKVVVTPELARNLLGPEKNRPELAERKPTPGVALGLGVSSGGGDLLIVEATRMPGKGEIFITGNMRGVMKESASTAVSFVRSRADRLKLDPEWLRKIDLHLHVPRAASVRDAAGAGLAMFVAVSSLLLEVPIKTEVAVTGELTLRGRILPVGGIKEQVLAAHRAGVRTVLIPARNERDFADVPSEVKDDLEVHFVSRLDQVLPLVLAEPSADSAAGQQDSEAAGADEVSA